MSEVNKPFVLGIAGGTGAGKSTLSDGLYEMLPGKVATVHLDDYFIPREEMPLVGNYRNHDEPSSVESGLLASDVGRLIGGHTITVSTKSSRLNPDYIRTGKAKTVEITPKPLIVVEGFLVLHFPELRELIDKSVYLDAPFEVLSDRRVHPADQAYKEAVIKPSLEKYLLPSSKHADLVIDVTQNSREQVLQKVVRLLPDYLL